MRIVLISWEYPPVMVGGLGRHVYELSKNLAQQGHEILIISRAEPIPGAHNSYEQIADNIQVIRVVEELGFSFFDDLVAWTLSLSASMLRTYFAFTPDFHPDIIHAHDWIVSQTAVTLAEYTQAPLILTMHATEAGRHLGWINTPTSQRIHSIEWWFMQQADHIIVCTEFMQQELQTIMGEQLTDISIIPNGIDQKFWSSGMTSVTRNIKAESSAQSLRLLFFGRLEYEKGVHDVILAMSEIIVQLPYAQLSIIGDGTQKTWLRDLVKTHKLAEHIHFYPHMHAKELRQAIDEHDIIILPSRYEPCGIVALEAAMRQKPQIVSARSGMAELLRTRSSLQAPETEYSPQTEYLGKICEPGDPHSIASAVHYISKNYTVFLLKAARLAEQLSSPVYDWQGVTNSTITIYEKICNLKHRRKHVPLIQFPERILPHRP